MKTIVTGALTILLSLLAGCKLSPPKSCYLLTTNNTVIFIDWTKTSQGIEGTMTMEVIENNGEIETSHAAFDGILDGENIKLTWKVTANSQNVKNYTYTMMDTLKDDTLTLFPQYATEPDTFHRVSSTECFEASRKLAARAMEIRAEKKGTTPH